MIKLSARIITAATIAALGVGCGGGMGGSKSETRSPGELAFRRHCQSCHSLPKPTKYAGDEWPALVARYGARAKLSDSTIALITLYLTSHN